MHRFYEQYSAVAEILGNMERFFFWNTIGAAAIIFATGGMRTFTYVDNIFGPAAENIRRTMLIAKHVILILLFAEGGYWA